LSLTAALVNCVGVIEGVGDSNDEGNADGSITGTTSTTGSASAGSTGAAGTFGSGGSGEAGSQGSGGSAGDPGGGAGGDIGAGGVGGSGGSTGSATGGAGGGSAGPDAGRGGMSGSGTVATGGAAGRGGAAGTTGGGGGPVGTVKFSQVSTIVSRTCGGCHSSFRNYNSLTTHSVSRCGGDTLIKANDPANSAILELVQGMCGSFLMPRGCSRAPCIPTADIQTITTWVNEGALNN
jgi:hypothetical protein